MIAAIENAIIARLQLAASLDLLGYRWLTATTYPADWDLYLKDKGTLRAPGFWVVFAGGPKPEKGFGTIRQKCVFGLIVLARNERSETATRQGGPIAKEPGSYKLIEDAIALLSGQTLGLDIDAIETGAVRIVRPQGALAEFKGSMLGVELTTAFEITQMPTDLASVDPVPFTILHANWDIPPFGGVDAEPGTPGIQLPDDVHADATDHLELPQ